jgi:hypothetical protein
MDTSPTSRPRKDSAERRGHIPGAKAQFFASLDVRTEVWTYLRSNGKGRSNSRSSSRMTTRKTKTKAETTAITARIFLRKSL